MKMTSGGNPKTLSRNDLLIALESKFLIIQVFISTDHAVCAVRQHRTELRILRETNSQLSPLSASQPCPAFQIGGMLSKRSCPAEPARGYPRRKAVVGFNFRL
jgi:hypothetical protein